MKSEEFIWVQESYTLSGEWRCVSNPLRSTCLFVCLSMWRWCLEAKTVSFWCQAVDEDCSCANSSHLRELVRTWGHVNLPPELELSAAEVNVTVDGFGCYACEPRRPPACTEVATWEVIWSFFVGEIRNEIIEISNLILSYRHLQIRDSTNTSTRPTTSAHQRHVSVATREPMPCCHGFSDLQLEKLVKRNQETTFWIQVKHSATTVDGSPCFYCLDSKSSIFPSKIGGFMAPRWSHQWSGLGKARDSHVRDCSPSLGDLAFWKEPGIAEKNLSREEHHRTSPWIYRYIDIPIYLHLRVQEDFNFNFMISSLHVFQLWKFASQCSGPPRKPARGSLRLSRRQGDRNRAIRVQQEPLRFYEEAAEWTWTVQRTKKIKEIRQLGSTYLAHTWIKNPDALYVPALFLHANRFSDGLVNAHTIFRSYWRLETCLIFLPRPKVRNFSGFLGSHILRLTDFFHYWYIVIYRDLSKSFRNDVFVGFPLRCETTWNHFHLIWGGWCVRTARYGMAVADGQSGDGAAGFGDGNHPRGEGQEAIHRKSHRSFRLPILKVARASPMLSCWSTEGWDFQLDKMNQNDTSKAPPRCQRRPCYTSCDKRQPHPCRCVWPGWKRELAATQWGTEPFKFGQDPDVTWNDIIPSSSGSKSTFIQNGSAWHGGIVKRIYYYSTFKTRQIPRVQGTCQKHGVFQFSGFPPVPPWKVLQSMWSGMSKNKQFVVSWEIHGVFPLFSWVWMVFFTGLSRVAI